VSSCLDPPRTSEGFLTAPPSGEVTPTTPAPHEQALVSLETAISQQVHQPITELLLADSNPDSHGALVGAGLPQLSALDRANCEAEASQMEMSPAPTIGERGGGGALDAVREGRLTLNPVKLDFTRCGSLEKQNAAKKFVLKRLSQNYCIPLHSTCILLHVQLPICTLHLLNCLPDANMRFIFPAFSASLSPDIAESSEPVPVGVSQLEGSPMDTSSPASGTQEEPAGSSAPPNHMSQELSGSGDSGLTDRQTDAETG